MRQSRVPHVRSKEKKTMENFSKSSDSWQVLFISCEYSLNIAHHSIPRRPTSLPRETEWCGPGLPPPPRSLRRRGSPPRPHPRWRGLRWTRRGVMKTSSLRGPEPAVSHQPDGGRVGGRLILSRLGPSPLQNGRGTPSMVGKESSGGLCNLSHEQVA